MKSRGARVKQVATFTDKRCPVSIVSEPHRIGEPLVEGSAKLFAGFHRASRVPHIPTEVISYFDIVISNEDLEGLQPRKFSISISLGLYKCNICKEIGLYLNISFVSA